MGEVRTEIRYIKVDMQCDHCRNGYMRLKVTKPILGKKIYVHECDRCGFIDNYDVRYPYKIEYAQ